MPDNATLAALDVFLGGFDTEILVMTTGFFNTFIEDNKVMN